MLTDIIYTLEIEVNGYPNICLLLQGIVPFQDVLKWVYIFHWKFHDYGRFRVCPKRPCRINTFLTENIAKVKRVLPLFLPRIWQPENQGMPHQKPPNPGLASSLSTQTCSHGPTEGVLYHPEGFWAVKLRRPFEPANFMAYGMTMASALQSRIPVRNAGF